MRIAPFIGLGAALLSAAAVQADPVAGLQTFSSGTPARASEVNDNFTAVKSAVDDNHEEIIALRAAVAELQEQLSNVIALNEVVSLESIDGHPTVRLTGVNLQVVSGGGTTSAINGTGNVIIGYNERSERPEDSVCSIGVMDQFTPEGVRRFERALISNEADCLGAGGAWSSSHTSGSHYLIVGSQNNYSSFGGIVAGQHNTSNARMASVLGGELNRSSEEHSVVLGGTSNATSGRKSSVVGGRLNEASGTQASVSGGIGNRAEGSVSSISGGRDNLARGFSSSVSGGLLNEALEQGTSILGGQENVAQGQNSSIVGGRDNETTTITSSILGGVAVTPPEANQTVPALP